MYPVLVADMLANGKEKQYMYITMTGLLFNIILNLIFIPYNWEYAAVVTLVTELLVALLIYFYDIKK